MKRIFSFLAAAGIMMAANAQNMEVRWHNEQQDTTRLASMLVEASTQKFANPSARVAWFGRQLLGTPYRAHTLEGETEALVVNLDSLDCTTFVETALALAATSAERRLGWQDCVYNLRKMRYRNGEVNGYASRLHYICDWAIDNIHRGNLKDITSNNEKCKYAVRTIDFMSSHRDAYPSLADSVEFQRIKTVESGYRNHRFPYIKTVDLNFKPFVAQLREGDIIAFVSSLKDLDVTHMGMIVMGDDGQPRVLHASQSHGKVEVSQSPLQKFVKANGNWIGVRVLRLAE